MQRKTVNRTKEGEKMGKLPFQFKHDPRNVDFEAAKQALQFFGGAEEETATESIVDDQPSATTQESVSTEPVTTDESAKG